MHEVANPYSCENCPLQSRPGLRPLEPQQLAYMGEFKEGEIALDGGESLLEQGDEGNRLYTLIEGVLIRFRTLDDGRRQIVSFMFPGDLTGLQGEFDEPASHSVEALTQARLCVFKRRAFIELISQHPRLGYDITWLAAKEERLLEDHIVALGQRSARERVTYLAVWLVDRGQEWGGRVIAGASRDCSSRVRKRSVRRSSLARVCSATFHCSASWSDSSSMTRV